MATNSNVFSQGGGGIAFENEVQSAFLISFLLGLNIPGIKGKICNIRFQSGSLGYKTDDLLLNVSGDERQSKVLIQIKHNLVISAKGEEFIDVLRDAWLDFRNISIFNPNGDNIFIIKSAMTGDERNHLKVLLDWARAKADLDDFLNEAERIKAKNHYLTIFKIVLSKLFPEDYSNVLLFKFLKRLYFLEFDLDNDGSIVRAGYLSLISRFKMNDAVSSEQLWNNIKAFISDKNPKGAQLDIKDIPSELSDLFFQYDAQTGLRNIHEVSRQNMEIIDLIEDQIGNFSLDRTDQFIKIEELLNDNKVLAISGDPGCGKSAIAKGYIKKVAKQLDGIILCFNAEDLSHGNLRDYFTIRQIHLTLKELFGFFTQFQNNIIYIDAAEKLLEATGVPLSQLMKSLREIPNVKVIISCRSSSLALIELKYFTGLPLSKIHLGPLIDEELDEIVRNVPVLQKLMENKRLKHLLSFPKYLDFANKAVMQTQQELNDIDEEKFREQLWVIIIENRLNGYNHGLPERRGKEFTEIAVARSRQMTRYAFFQSTDPDAIENLLKDNVLVQSGNNQHYAPAHDVLEDWALMRFVNHLYGRKLPEEQFFGELGNEPAMRRAYRLWVQAALKGSSGGPIQFAAKYLFETSDNNFWKDESLIGILYAEQSETFFERFEDKLKNDDFAPLFSLIQVMRTSCRENLGTFYKKNYVPRGYGWQPVLRLIRENINKINKVYYDLIYLLVHEWSTIINNQYQLPEGTRDAGLIILHLIKHHFDLEDRHNTKNDEVVQTLCLLAGGIVPELKKALSEPALDVSDEKDDENIDYEIWYGEKLRSRVVKLALNGPHSAQLARYLPDEIIELARLHWLLTMEKVFYPANEFDHFVTRSRHSSMDYNHHFGLKNEDYLNYSPPSAYQTPILSLLRHHPQKTIDFMIEVVNWCTSNYRHSEFSQEDKGVFVDLELEDGIKVTQYGNSYLWCIFRSSNNKVSPYILQSMLMALERYFMDEFDKGLAEAVAASNLIDHIYLNSTSVCLTAVIASVCQAFPALTGKQIIPLLSARKLISWDVSRYSNDQLHSHFSLWDPLFDNERKASDKLPHRLRFYGGLRGFFPLYCYQYGAYKERIFSIIDRHRKEARTDDLQWRKILDEIDLRTWRVTKTIKTTDTISYQIEPSYNPDLQEFVSDLKQQIESKSENDRFSTWLWKVKKNDIQPEISQWRDIYGFYSKVEKFSFLEHQPGKLAEIGVRFFWNELLNDERQWSLETIVRIMRNKINRAYQQFNMEIENSTLDCESALSAFPVLLGYDDLPQREDFEFVALEFLTSPFQENDPDITHFHQGMSNSLWDKNLPLAMRLLNGLLEFSKFTKKHSVRGIRQKSEEEINQYWDLYQDFILKGIQTGYNPDIVDLNFENNSIFYVSRALTLLPIKTENAFIFKIVQNIYHIFLQTFKIDDTKRPWNENREFGHRIGILLQDRISKMILWNDNDLGKELFRLILLEGQTNIRQSVEAKSRKTTELFQFYRRIIEGVILEADRTLPDDDPVKSEITCKKFNSAWRVFAQYMLQPESISMFADQLLLDTEVGWRSDVTNWKPLAEESKLYNAIVQTFGTIRINSAIVLLSHIGDENLLMGNLQWLVEKLKNPKIGSDINASPALEQLAVRVYQNHLDTLLENREIFNDYLWLLDNLVSQQSSDAYWIREFMISFK